MRRGCAGVPAARQPSPGRRADCFARNARCSWRIVLGEFSVERGEADAQEDRRLFLVAAHMREYAVQISHFLFAEKILEWNVLLRRGGGGGVTGCGRRRLMQRKKLRRRRGGKLGDFR